jgi:cytochrome c
MKIRRLAAAAAVAVLALAALSFFHPWGDLRGDASEKHAVLAGAKVPDEVREMLIQKCGDCHSNGTRWPLYSRIAPSSWLVERDVHEGREHMNLSRWEQYSIDSQIDLLGKMGSQLRQGKMPLRQYLLLHPEARLSEAERKLIVDWTKAERKSLMADAAK